MIVLGIDIGIVNLGMVQVEIDDIWDIKNVHMCERVDMTRLCASRETTDRVTSMVEKYKMVFDTSDVILIERQPLTGITGVEELLFYMFREKCKKISPNAMHKYLGINIYNYEERKERTIARAETWLGKRNTYTNETRKHDMADAFCIILWWINHNKPSGPNPWENFRFV